MSEVDRMAVIRHDEHAVVDLRRFLEAVHAIERENFRPGNAIDALERALVEDDDPANPYRGAVEALRAYRSALRSGEPESDQLRALSDAVLREQS